METLTITYEQAARIKELLRLFIGPGPLIVQEGSMKIDDVTLEWKNDVVRVSLNKDFFTTLETELKDHENDHC